MKEGASKSDQAKIKKMHADNKSTAEISAALGISKKVIKAFTAPVKEAKEAKETK